MSEHPVGYEAEKPVDLSRPISVTPVPRQAAGAERGVNVVAVANVKPGTGKTATAAMLRTALADRLDRVTLWTCVRDRPVPARTVLSPSGRGLVVIDTTSGPGDEWRQQIHSADVLVIPVPVEAEAARAAAWMLEQLNSAGYGALVGTVTAVIRSEGDRDRGLARRIRRYFGRHTGGVVELRRGSEPTPTGVAVTSPWRDLGDVVLTRLEADPVVPLARRTSTRLFRPPTSAFLRKATS